MTVYVHKVETKLTALEHLLTLHLPRIPWEAIELTSAPTGEHDALPPLGIALLDADVCIHAAMSDSPAREACAWVITEIAHGRLNAAVDVAVVQEIIEHVGGAGRRDQAYELIHSLMQIVPIHYPMQAQDALLAANLCRMREAQVLRPSGCIHIAIMQHNGLNTIISLDPAYDRIPDITRLDPLALYRKVPS